MASYADRISSSSDLLSSFSEEGDNYSTDGLVTNEQPRKTKRNPFNARRGFYVYEHNTRQSNIQLDSETLNSQTSLQTKYSIKNTDRGFNRNSVTNSQTQQFRIQQRILEFPTNPRL